ncbi:hypothetical protein JCM17478_17650 [Thermopirellula anaerolimosa]
MPRPDFAHIRADNGGGVVSGKAALGTDSQPRPKVFPGLTQLPAMDPPPPLSLGLRPLRQDRLLEAGPHPGEVLNDVRTMPHLGCEELPPSGTGLLARWNGFVESVPAAPQQDP